MINVEGVSFCKLKTREFRVPLFDIILIVILTILNK